MMRIQHSVRSADQVLVSFLREGWLTLTVSSHLSLIQVEEIRME